MIRLKTQTKLKESLKLLNYINTFLFEQEYEELNKFTPAQKKKIQDAANTLMTVINQNK